MAESKIPILPVMKPILYSDLIPVTTLTNGENYIQGCSYMKIGCFVLIYVSVVFTTPPTNITIFTLPEGYRPVRETLISASGGASYNAKGECAIRPNGNVAVSSVDNYITASGLFVVSV